MTDRDQSPPGAAATKSTKPAASAARSQSDAALEPSLQAHIGRQLRAIYDEVVQQPVPDRFVQLLEELERKKAGGHE